ncbi:PREDICTED: uncharacterized protein LOC108567973 [Nicrophorus vespilloides]|uniref:Uncharacterized protein LOC108567973 n=1 Tax=Nicrophorus vespilloides TaxID=110193 RepID=A0ABM1NBT7_NICVS|nr:PREDICTED: uncharacterized protein LOC108567973 [Nicrophorus vespilloides]
MMESLHWSLSGVITFGQIFALFPITGIYKCNPCDLEFSWTNWKTIYSLIAVLGNLFIIFTVFYEMVRIGTDLYIASVFVFHFCKICITLSFLYLAKHWPRLMREWMAIERHFKTYGSIKITNKIRILSITLLTFTTAQYIVFQITRFTVSERCAEHDTIKHFYTIVMFPYVFEVFSYSIWIAVFLQIIDVFSAIAWSYVDLIIMILSSALALRFKQITDKLEVMAESKIIYERSWKILREDYNKLCRLCKCLDNAISYVVLMSFGSNLFFILIQLFNSLRPMKTNLDKFYFFFSFGFLIMRTIFVSIYAASVNDESKKPISILSSVPSHVYNLEIRRFIQQISFNSIAITGRNFFSVTRGLILSIAGAIVTYELVLIQFNEQLLRAEAENPTDIFKKWQMLVSKGTQSRASNIQQSLRGVLIVANIFSLIPISGVIRNTNLRFRCLSAKVLYSLSNILITSFILSVAFYHSITYDTDFPQIVEDIFYVSSIVTSILFLHLARNWPKLITKWSRVDASMAYKYGFLKNLDLRIKLTMITFLTLATVPVNIDSNKPKKEIMDLEIYKRIFSGIRKRTRVSLMIHENTTENLQISFRWILLLSQFFGILPFQGVMRSSGDNLSFKLASFKVFFSCTIFAMHIFMATMSVFDMINDGIDFRSLNVTMIYVPGLLIHLMFFKLALRWPSLMKAWCELETSMRKYGYPKRLSRTINIQIVFIVLASLIEYSFSVWSSFYAICETLEKGQSPLKEMTETMYSFVLQYTGYSTTFAVFLLAANFVCMFIWNFMDLFIMILSGALSERYSQITRRIKIATDWNTGQEVFWKSIREDYNEVTKLFRKLESCISSIVLLSFSINLYYILVQLFQSLHQKHNGVESLYFFLSFGLLLLRTVAVALFAAKVNEESKQPLQYLTLVPSEIYSVEVERLMIQICHDPIALTGYRLFYITRGLIFTIAGTIVTYELFLFQFNISATFYK